MLNNFFRRSLVGCTKQFRPCMLPVTSRNFWGGGKKKDDEPDFDISKDLYKVLDLSKNASAADIKN